MQKIADELQTSKLPAPRSRGRPRVFDREAALAAATQLFWEKGYEATSLAELTKVMGIGAPSLYAAFGSKEALYAEALDHYGKTNQAYIWTGFSKAPTAREAVRLFLMDSAAALTDCSAGAPRGCMVTLSAVGSEGHAELGAQVKAKRAVTVERVFDRLQRAAEEGELAGASNLHALARFVQTVQNGMSILARDGASRAELEDVAELAMLGWDAQVAKNAFTAGER
jgi:AcrR family transcriptional regulator